MNILIGSLNSLSDSRDSESGDILFPCLYS